MAPPDHEPQKCYVALGSNLGDRRANVEAAIELLTVEPGISNLYISDLMENPAIGGPAESPSFLNAIAELRTVLSPHDLLSRLLDIEKRLGRVRREKWEPRLIDLDLILYGNQIIHTDDLVVPHPLMHQRRFVLQPLAQLCPDLIHPVLQQKVSEILKQLG